MSSRTACSSVHIFPAMPNVESTGGTQVGISAGAKDNRAIEASTDALTFATAPLMQDVEAVSPVHVPLHTRSTTPHADDFARLRDVDTRGRSVNVYDGIDRLREPGSIRAVEVTLWPMAHRVPTRPPHPAAGLQRRPSVFRP